MSKEKVSAIPTPYMNKAIADGIEKKEMKRGKSPFFEILYAPALVVNEAISLQARLNKDMAEQFGERE